MRARDARAKGIEVDGDVPDGAELEPRGYQIEGDMMVRTWSWRWQMACYANVDGSIPESRAIVHTTAAERGSMRRHPWSRH
jgi:hypothetical protein